MAEVRCVNGNLDHFSMILLTPYEEVDTTAIPKEIRNKNREYLYHRVGPAFFNRLHYYSSQNIDFKQYETIKEKRGLVNEELWDPRVRYAFQYYFIVQDSMRYYLSTVYDKQGNLISEHQLPDIARNSDLSQIIDICKAKQIIEADRKYKGALKKLSLEYSLEHDALVWEGQKPSIREGKKVDTPFVIVHAQTGKTLGYRVEKGIVVCQLPEF